MENSERTFEESKSNRGREKVNKEKLKFMYSNLDVFPNKREEIITRIDKNSADVICFTEIKPKKTSAPLRPQEIAIDGYECWCSLDSSGRGVAIYTRDQLRATPVDTPPYIDCSFCDVTIKGNEKILIGCVYRSPNSSIENNNKLCELFRWAVNLNYAYTIICGDFNFPEIDWKHSIPNVAATHPASSFLETVNDLHLIQQTDRPTHQRSQSERATQIDLVFTDSNHLMDEIFYEEPLGYSHHSTLIFTIDCEYEVEKSSNKTRQLPHKGDYDNFRTFMDNQDWATGPDSSVEDLWTELKEVITEGSLRYIPTFTPNPDRKPKPQYMDAEAYTAVKAKSVAYKRWQRTGQGEQWLEYLKARNKARKATRKAMRRFEKNIAMNSKSNPKAFYKYVNGRLKTRSKIPELELDGVTGTTDQEKAQLLNRQFASVFSDDGSSGTDASVPSSQIPLNFQLSMPKINITEEEVLKLLLNLDANKSVGPDSLHPRILLELSRQLVPRLVILFRRSLETSQVPVDWKKANITPIYKKGSKKIPENYRPVSLTSILSKVMERIISSRMIFHCEQQGILTDVQYGFRQRRSCNSQLLNVMETWTDWIEQGDPFDCIYFDFMKAFDKVSHRLLIEKMTGLGISQECTNWTREYLTDREQVVVVNGEKSDPLAVRSGVPQGSVIGPTLFILFINDLPSCASNQTRLFADDTKLFGVVNTNEDQERLQSDIDAFTKWANEWKMKFHPSKCKVLHFGGKNLQYHYEMQTSTGRTELAVEHIETDLGILTDNKLTFSNHVAEVAKKANQRLGMIRRGFRYISSGVMKNLYKSMVRPILEGGVSVWHPSKKGDIKALERIQHRATKMVSHIQDLPYNQRLRSLGLPSLVYRRKRGDMIEVYKRLNGAYNDSFPWLQLDERECGLRSNGLKLCKKRCISKSKSKVFSSRVVNDWNSLPSEIVSAKDLNSFKTKLDKFWKNKCYEESE